MKAELKTVVCPCCGKVNHAAHDDGAVDGPREYHAECWAKASETMTDEEIKQAWAESLAVCDFVARIVGT